MTQKGAVPEEASARDSVGSWLPQGLQALTKPETAIWSIIATGEADNWVA